MVSVDAGLALAEPFIGIIASERRSDLVERDDLMQELRIAAWRALQCDPGNPKGYLIATVKNRAARVLGRRNWTGAPSRQGKALDALDCPRDSFEGLSFLPGPDLLENFEQDFGDIHEALEGLPAHVRSYCVLRFWYGMTEPEIADALGVPRKMLNNHWNRARPALASRLAHLRAA